MKGSIFTVLSIESQSTFPKNMSPAIREATNQREEGRTCFHVGFLFGSFFGPEDGGDMFLRYIGLFS
jgi:hypothetical protein